MNRDANGSVPATVELKKRLAELVQALREDDWKSAERVCEQMEGELYELRSAINVEAAKAEGRKP